MGSYRLGLSIVESFQRIETFYIQYYHKLKKTGVHPYKQTEKGFWFSSVSRDVFDLFRAIRLEQFNHFADLGSGDGKVALIASLFTKSTGIECDEELVKRSIHIEEKLGLQNVRFVRGDFLKEKLSGYDALFIYPDNPLICLERKILKEFGGDLIVCGGIFLPEKLVKKKIVHINNAVFGIYHRGWFRWP